MKALWAWIAARVPHTWISTTIASMATSLFTSLVYVHVALTPSHNLTLTPVAVDHSEACSISMGALDQKLAPERPKLDIEESNLRLVPAPDGQWAGLLRREYPGQYTRFLLAISTDFITRKLAAPFLAELTRDKIASCPPPIVIDGEETRDLPKTVVLDGEVILSVARPARYAVLRDCILKANGHSIGVRLFAEDEKFDNVGKTITVQQSQSLFLKYAPSMAPRDGAARIETQRALHELILSKRTAKGCSVAIECRVFLPLGRTETIAAQPIILKGDSIEEAGGFMARLNAYLWG